MFIFLVDGIFGIGFEKGKPVLACSYMCDEIDDEDVKRWNDELKLCLKKAGFKIKIGQWTESDNVLDDANYTAPITLKD